MCIVPSRHSRFTAGFVSTQFLLGTCTMEFKRLRSVRSRFWIHGPVGHRPQTVRDVQVDLGGITGESVLPSRSSGFEHSLHCSAARMSHGLRYMCSVAYENTYRGSVDPREPQSTELGWLLCRNTDRKASDYQDDDPYVLKHVFLRFRTSGLRTLILGK